jgi:DNA-binding MarR family transcriptional regulator
MNLRGCANESLSLSPSDVGNAIVSLSRRGLIDRIETEDGTFFSLRSIVKKFILQLT